LKSNEPVKKSSRPSEAGVRVLYKVNLLYQFCPARFGDFWLAGLAFPLQIRLLRPFSLLLAACSAPCGQTQGAEEEGGWGREGADFWNGTPGQGPRPTTLIHE
jgi:hypothetical protein